MTPRARLLSALECTKPDRLPVTVPHVMPGFLEKCLGGMSREEFFAHFCLDSIRWVSPRQPEESQCESIGFSRKESISGTIPHSPLDSWYVEKEILEENTCLTVKFKFHTPRKKLTMILQSNEYTEWVLEPLIKEKGDIDIFGEYAPVTLCDREEVNRQAQDFGEKGIIQGIIPGFEFFGQSGCWQDACCLAGGREMNLAAHGDAEWVHAFLSILRNRKLQFIRSLRGAHYDLLELGGENLSGKVNSPRFFEEFVEPYDSVLIAAAHSVGQRIVYDACDAAMPILEMISDMEPDAVEIFTPPDNDWELNLGMVKQRIGSQVCIIGGFDHFHYLHGSTPEDTRKAVRRCFEEAGKDGGYILAPCGHLFYADLYLLRAFVEAARECRYSDAPATGEVMAYERFPPLLTSKSGWDSGGKKIHSHG